MDPVASPKAAPDLNQAAQKPAPAEPGIAAEAPAPARAHPGATALAGWLAAFAAAHVVVGLGFVALLGALGHGGALGPAEAIGILTAAHLGGIVAVVAPAGLGVREALLAALLAPALGVEAAVAVALVARAWATLGDALVAPLALLPQR